MKKNLLALLLFGTLLVLSKKPCICDNDEDDDDNGGNGDDDGAEEGGVVPITPSTTAGIVYEYVTTWVWREGQKKKIRRKKRHKIAHKKAKKTVDPWAADPWPAPADPWGADPADPAPLTTALGGEDEGNGNGDDDGNGMGMGKGNGDDDDDDGGNGEDDDDDDEDDCICSPTTSAKPLPICHDGWEAWDFCVSLMDCPQQYYCTWDGGCCPEMPWRQNKVSGARANGNRLTNELEYYYVNHPGMFIVITGVISVVLFAGLIGAVYLLCLRKAGNVKQRLMDKHIENSELVAVNYNDKKVDINMDTYQNNDGASYQSEL